jgi:hypothetical protein
MMNSLSMQDCRQMLCLRGALFRNQQSPTDAAKCNSSSERPLPLDAAVSSEPNETGVAAPLLSPLTLTLWQLTIAG